MKTPTTEIVRAHDIATVTASGSKLKQARKGEKQLGDIFWYSVPKDIATGTTEFEEMATRHGIVQDWWPSHVTPISAFKRAVKEVKDRQGVAKVLDADGNVLESVVIVDAPRQPRYKHIVLQVREGHEKPKHPVLGAVEFTDDDRFASECKTALSTEIARFETMVETIDERRKYHEGHYLDTDIRGLISDARKDLAAVPVRESGGIYFVPICNRPELEALSGFLKEIGCKPSVLPVSEMTYESEDLAHYAMTNIQYETSVLLKSVTQARKSKPTARGAHTIIEGIKRIEKLQKTYQDLLETDLEASSIQVKALRVAARKALQEADE